MAGGNTSTLVNRTFNTNPYILKCIKGNKKEGYKKGKEVICKSVYVAYWRKGTKVWRVVSMEGNVFDFLHANWERMEINQ